MTLFTSQSAAMFYDKLFSSLDFTLPRAATGRRGFPKEAMVCAFIVMKCEGFSQITDLMDYLDNNRLIAHYCGFNIMEPLPSYWTYDRFLRQLDNSALKSIMADLVKKLYEMGIVDASFIGLDSTPVAANTKQNNPKSFTKDKFNPEKQPKADPDCAVGAQRRKRGKSQYAGPHLRPGGCVGRRSAWFSLLPFCQTASAFRLICLFHTFCRRGVYRAMVFAPLRCL